MKQQRSINIPRRTKPLGVRYTTPKPLRRFSERKERLIAARASGFEDGLEYSEKQPSAICYFEEGSEEAQAWIKGFREGLACMFHPSWDVNSVPITFLWEKGDHPIKAVLTA